MSLNIAKDVEKQRLRAVCGRNMGDSAPYALVMQIERVWSRITGDEEKEKARKFSDIIAAFRTKGLIPACIFELCQSDDPRLAEKNAIKLLDAESLAVGFAACAYPQRGFQMGETELGLRFQSFLEAYETLSACATAKTAEQVALGLISINRLPETMSQADLGLFLSDLSGAECVGQQDARQEEDERRSGAAVYLASCYPDLVSRAYERWRDQAGFVRYLRKYLASPPSYLAHEDRSNEGSPQWSRVRARLAQVLAEEPPEHHDMAVILEQMAWKEARRWIPSTLVSQMVCGFWEYQWEKLTSGFPFYAFRSRLTYWWKQCLSNYRFSEHRTVPLGESEPDSTAQQKLSVDDERIEFNPEQLRGFREGYRLIRTTFFRRADKKAGVAGVPVDHADANERLREALDAIWYERLESQMGQDLAPEAIKKIADRFPELGPHSINDLSHRLRMRIWAYTLARLGHRNSEILSARRPARHARRGATEYPLAKEPAVTMLSSLVRMIPPERTLLSAFTAQVFLHPRVEPQRPDPWSFKRYLRELWHWVTEETFRDGVSAGVAQENRADAALDSAAERTPFKELLRDLSGLQTVSELDRYIDGRNLWLWQEAAVNLINDLVGTVGLHMTSEEALRAWRREIGGEGHHWIVPVWYLTFVEQLDEGKLLARMKVDDHEAEAVVRLSQAMRADVAAQAMRARQTISLRNEP